MNQVILMGRLTRDPDVRYSQGSQPIAIARYTLAVDRRSRSDEQNADFISCVAFGRSAEFAEKYLQQGTKILIRGRIQTGSYTNRDGQKVYTTDVVVEEHEFAESKAASQNSGSNYGEYSKYSQEPRQADPERASSVGDGFMRIPDGVDDYGLDFN